MEESEWITSQNPVAMLNHLVYKLVIHDSVVLRDKPLVSDRKLRLTHEAWESNLCGDERWTMGFLYSGSNVVVGRCLATEVNITTPYKPVAANLLREIVGNPFRPLPSVRAFGEIIIIGWLTPTVVEMAQHAYESQDFSNLPVIADALEEAGCCDDTMLTHLRGDGMHVRGCWAIDLLLGLE